MVELLLLLLLLLLLFHKLCTIYVIAYGMIMKYVRIWTLWSYTTTGKCLSHLDTQQR